MGKGTRPPRLNGPQEGQKTLGKQRAFKHQLNGRRGLPAAAIRERIRTRRGGAARARPAEPGLAPRPARASPHHTGGGSGEGEPAPRLQTPARPPAPWLTQKMRLRKTRTVLEEVMPHCPMAPAAAARSPRLGSAALSAATRRSAPPRRRPRPT